MLDRVYLNALADGLRAAGSAAEVRELKALAARHGVDIELVKWGRRRDRLRIRAVSGGYGADSNSAAITA
jgi:hypothetical protein